MHSALPSPARPRLRPRARTGARTAAVLCAAAWLAGCGDARGGAGAPARADTAAEPAVAAPAPPPPAPAAEVEPEAPGRGEPSGPTAADSAAAAAEDVTPEWKMNERNMAPYEECMAMTRDAPPEVRVRLEEACRRLPTAPGRNER